MCTRYYSCICSGICWRTEDRHQDPSWPWRWTCYKWPSGWHSGTGTLAAGLPWLPPCQLAFGEVKIWKKMEIKTLVSTVRCSYCWRIKSNYYYNYHSVCLLISILVRGIILKVQRVPKHCVNGSRSRLCGAPHWRPSIKTTGRPLMSVASAFAASEVLENLDWLPPLVWMQLHHLFKIQI